jgi:hypothetical protein
MNLLNLRVTAAIDPSVPLELAPAGVPSSSTSGIIPAVPPNAPGAGSVGSGVAADASAAGAEVSLELSFEELSSEELSEEEPSSVEPELEELDESPELLPKDPDVPGVVVELAIELDAAVTELSVLTAAADVLEAKAPVVATDEAEVTEVVVPLPAPAPPLLADTMTKSTQLSYVCFAAVPNQNHCSTHSPATLQSLAARSVGIVTAKLVLLAGRTLSFSSA